MTVTEDMMDALFARLSHYCHIGQAERDALETVRTRARTYQPGDDVIEKGDEPEVALIIKSGWAARYITLEDGRTQILNFLLPGDIFDLQVFIAEAADHSIAAITKLEVFSIPRRDFLNVFSQDNNLGLAFWWATLQEEAILREQIVRNGRRNASERIAHLLLELHRRALIIGEGNEDAFHLPVSQVLIADALGLSYVHVSRVLRRFFADGLIERRKSVLLIKDRSGLIGRCDFSPAYLHLDAQPPRYRLRPAPLDTPSGASALT